MSWPISPELVDLYRDGTITVDQMMLLGARGQYYFMKSAYGDDMPDLVSFLCESLGKSELAVKQALGRLRTTGLIR